MQGGGSHGAFTWGVLDRLLEEPWLRFEGISGTSAGTMNAAVMISGFTQGGADGARKALEAFWRRVADAARDEGRRATQAFLDENGKAVGKLATFDLETML